MGESNEDILNRMEGMNKSELKNLIYQLLYDKDRMDSLRNWGWDELKNEFDKIRKEDINLALSFLYRLIAEKAICENKQCPAFESLGKVGTQIFELEYRYGPVFNLKKGEQKFKFDKYTFGKWNDLYRRIQYKLTKAWEEIAQIGIPNQTKKEKINETLQRNLEKIEMMGKHGVQYTGQFGKDVDEAIVEDERTLYLNNPEYRKEYNIFEKERKKQQKKRGKGGMKP